MKSKNESFCSVHQTIKYFLLNFLATKKSIIVSASFRLHRKQLNLIDPFDVNSISFHRMTYHAQTYFETNTGN